VSVYVTVVCADEDVSLEVNVRPDVNDDWLIGDAGTGKDTTVGLPVGSVGPTFVAEARIGVCVGDPDCAKGWSRCPGGDGFGCWVITDSAGGDEDLLAGMGSGGRVAWPMGERFNDREGWNTDGI
jgi:hypothetical protein